MMVHVSARCWALVAGIAFVGCGGGDEPEGVAAGGGTVTEAWQGYCVATFTEPYTVIDDFGDAVLTVGPGDAYLLLEYGSSFGEDRAVLAYLTPAGPAEFEVAAAPGSQAFPFTSNCGFGSGVEYYAAFVDVRVFTDEQLSAPLCDIAAGTALPATAESRGYSSAGGLSLSGPQTYQVYLNAFGPLCGGAELGYIGVPETQALGSTTWLVPIRSLLGPQ